jgi:hypothetical protein
MGNNYDPVTLHKYLYANVDPVNNIDPTGNLSIGSLMAGINTAARLVVTSIPNYTRSLLRGVVKEGSKARLSLRSQVWVWITRAKAYRKIPKEWGKAKLNAKAVKKGRSEKPGIKWSNGKKDSVRIDKGSSSSSNPSQRVDHVRINKDGRIIGRNGKQLPAGARVKDHGWETHIPLNEWIRWSKWYKP